jgi:methylmalonyl-CoA/ethylmalonyl-CoA epimerase
MLGDVIELSVVVHDLDAAAARYTRLFGLREHHRGESKDFGFRNAILPLGAGHIELLQPTDATKAAGRFLARRGEGVYLVGFECADIPGAVAKLRAGRQPPPGPRVGTIHVRPTASSSSSAIASDTTDYPSGLACVVPRSATASPRALRECGGCGEPFPGRSRNAEERHGFAGALRECGGCGGPFRGPPRQ